jgi:hypothetical protein
VRIRKKSSLKIPRPERWICLGDEALNQSNRTRRESYYASPMAIEWRLVSACTKKTPEPQRTTPSGSIVGRHKAAAHNSEVCLRRAGADSAAAARDKAQPLARSEQGSVLVGLGGAGLCSFCDSGCGVGDDSERQLLFFAFALLAGDYTIWKTALPRQRACEQSKPPNLACNARIRRL